MSAPIRNGEQLRRLLGKGRQSESAQIAVAMLMIIPLAIFCIDLYPLGSELY